MENFEFPSNLADEAMHFCRDIDNQSFFTCLKEKSRISFSDIKKVLLVQLCAVFDDRVCPRVLL